MAFKNLDTKTRYNIIRAGVRAGITKVSDIEKLFDEGGNLTNDEQKQLDWSKNWHTERVNYMHWTDEQKNAYLKAIDNTYSDNKFTRNIRKPMGFTPKDGNININYDDAEKTIYGNMAQKSGLVHELAHKLSYNSNIELNKTDHITSTVEDALLRAKKLNKLVHPLEIGGLQNANNFVDYNANPKDARIQEKEFRKQGVYNSKNTATDSYGHNLIEVKAKLDELRYRLNLSPAQMDIRPESVKKWRQREKLPSSLDDYSDEQIANMLNTFAYNNINIPTKNNLII